MVRTWKLTIALLLMSTAVRADILGDGIVDVGALQVPNWSVGQLLQMRPDDTFCSISTMFVDSGGSPIIPCLSPDPATEPAPIQFDVRANTAAMMSGCVDAIHSSIGQLGNVAPLMFPGVGEMASLPSILDAIVPSLLMPQ